MILPPSPLAHARTVWRHRFLEYLHELNKRIDVWVELGVQTCHDSTLKAINRGHDWQTSQQAIRRLDEKGLKVAVHLILGLPGENEDHYAETIKKLSALPIAALKLHNLHILKNTALADLFQKSPFPVYNEHQYTEVLLKLLPHIPSHWPLMRLTTDSRQEDLLAPHWQMTKTRFRKHLLSQMKARTIVQGMALRNPETNANPMQSKELAPVQTDDGTVTYYHAENQRALSHSCRGKI